MPQETASLQIRFHCRLLKGRKTSLLMPWNKSLSPLAKAIQLLKADILLFQPPAHTDMIFSRKAQRSRTGHWGLDFKTGHCKPWFWKVFNILYSSQSSPILWQGHFVEIRQSPPERSIWLPNYHEHVFARELLYISVQTTCVTFFFFYGKAISKFKQCSHCSHA